MTATATEATDDQLVSAARDGSDEAFEVLFRRYRDRVVGYVRGMVSDHGRAEDIVQEAFMSALRSLRRSEQEIVFRPWIYEIAKNACIDHLRRARRAQEVSIDSEDFGPLEESRLSQASTGTDAAVARRAELESLRMAFHDLPSSQHQILVMRELEGLSYDRIGRRMGLTRGAVESLLFRARRRLRDGFDEIDTGERCVSTRHAMDAMAAGNSRARDNRRLASHLQDCKPCRRHAVAMGLDSLVLVTQTSRMREALHRAAALLPVPAFVRRRLDDAGIALGSAHAGVEQGSSLAAKAAAVVVAAALAAGGAGMTHKATGGDLPLIGASKPQATADGSGGAAVGGGTMRNAAHNGAQGLPFDATGGAAPGGPLGGRQGGAGGPMGPMSPSSGPGTPGRAGEPVTNLGTAGLGALPGKTVDSLGKGDVAGPVKDVVGKVKKAPDKVKEITNSLPTTDVTTPKVKAPKVKAPKVKVKTPKGGAVDTGQGGTGTPSITLPQTEIPNTGTTGLQVPLVGGNVLGP